MAWTVWEGVDGALLCEACKDCEPADAPAAPFDYHQCSEPVDCDLCGGTIVPAIERLTG